MFFRHISRPLYSFFSLDLESKLHSLRLQGQRGVVTAGRLRSWQILEDVGLHMTSAFSDLSPSCPISGSLGVRRNAGKVFRWAEGWLGPIRFGVGWDVQKNDLAGIDVRIQLLSKIFVRERGSTAMAVEDSQLCICE